LSANDLEALGNPLADGLVGRGIPSVATGTCSGKLEGEPGCELSIGELSVGEYGADENGEGDLSNWVGFICGAFEESKPAFVVGTFVGKTGAPKDSLPDGSRDADILEGEPRVATEPDGESLKGALRGKLVGGLVDRFPG